tara:strand:- start:147 stop:350 length:204 start_codon:yes stop_codon:yes gene_type:complete
MIKLKDIMNEAIEQEMNIPFEMVGNNAVIVKGRKLTVKLKFNGNDLKDVVDGKKKTGKIVIASVNIK